MKRSVIGTLLALAVALSAVLLPSCTEKAEPIVVGYSPFAETALLLIADDQGYFSRNGLEVTLQGRDIPLRSLEAMKRGEVDIAGITEFPLVGSALQGDRVMAIVCYARSEAVFMVGRKNRGIETVPDLKGKRIGTIPGTIANFYLGRLLELHGMGIGDVTIVNFETYADGENLLANGGADAIIVPQPYADSTKGRIGPSAFVSSAQSGQALYSLWVSTEDWIQGHPGLVAKFLRSLAQAEEFLIQHPTEAKGIVTRRLGDNGAYVDTVWPQIQFGLSLSQSLIAAMEDEARWMIGNGLTSEQTVPDFRRHIWFEDLEAIAPDAVDIIR